MKYILLLLCLLHSSIAISQTGLSVFINNQETNAPIPNASIMANNVALGQTNENGLALLQLPEDEELVLTIKAEGYFELSDTLGMNELPDTIRILLVPNESAEDLEGITVNATRSNRSIADLPTRVEVINGEELDEKSNMKPGDIRMLLSESTGIQTQQTSATTGNASIRIQGLDGRYTQILKDGFPIYSGAASGLGLLQIPPLDLKQVEVIKGAVSTLYGGGAIAGLINLVSKTPEEKRELRFHINGTSAGGLDINGFYGQRFGKIGLTLFASRNSNAPYDPSSTDFTAIPKFERYTVNPRLFLYFNEKTTLIVGINATTENRMGGDLHYIKGEVDSLHNYYEANKSDRISTQAALTHELGGNRRFILKSSYSYFNRNIQVPGYEYEGRQDATYTELSYGATNESLDWIAGINLVTDGFREDAKSAFPLRNYQQTIAGVFGQGTLKMGTKWYLETGLRLDHVIDYGWAFLPRASLLYKHSPRLTSRIGGGFGYKPPTIFTEESERIQYRNVLPISSSANTLERSYGANWDINYRTSLFKGLISVSMNQLLFYTKLTDPLQLIQMTGAQYQFVNSSGHYDSKGTETNIKLGYKDFKLYLGYTYTDARLHMGDIYMKMPLIAPHRLNTVLVYEVEEKWKVGLEGYYYSTQRLSTGEQGRDYWLGGFMVERLWEHFSIYINFENFLDIRQTKFESIYTGSRTNPQFRDIYAPLDGFVINGGIKLKL